MCSSMLLTMLVFTLLLASSVLALPNPRNRLSKRAVTPIYNGAEVADRTFDYVVVGGGLSGSVLASRLSEEGGKSVLLIEAGYDEEGREEVTDAGQYQSTFDTWLDWQYPIVPQSGIEGDNQWRKMRAGRGLGGSTIINGMAWSKPHDFQLDSLQELGNEGINWATLQPYMLKAEQYTPPSDAQLQAGVTFADSCHGKNGVVGVQNQWDGMPNELERLFNRTAQDSGMPYVSDLTCGNPAGLGPIAHSSVDGIRSDAYRCYLWRRELPNLTLLAGANAGKVILSNDATPRATGIEFKDENGAIYTVNAGLEVIMATGAVKTPLILQHSGIGPKAFLDPAGVAQRVDLPVGQNLIDQVTITTNWRMNAPRGGGQQITWPRLQDLFEPNSEESTMVTNELNNLNGMAQSAVNAQASSHLGGLTKIFEIQRDWILNKAVAMSENFDYSWDGTIGFDSWFLLPFSRGLVKIANSDPYSSDMTLDPRYHSVAFDKYASGATARFTRDITHAEPLNSHVSNDGATSAGENADLSSWTAWVESQFRPNWHPIGTVPMMSRDLGGCVDSSHRVYGVNGLRVVDGSNLPFQVSSHLMSVLYGFAERAADVIKAAHASSCRR